MNITKQKLVKFWERVNKKGPIVYESIGRCWMWLGPTMCAGYGKAGTLGLTHRFAWILHNGKIPKGASVLHKCDNKLCVNPNHLFLGTQQDNLKDMRDKGHQVRGEQQGSSKLCAGEVFEIRARYKRYCRKNGTSALAKEFGVGPVQIYKIIRGWQWKHLLTD